MYYNKIKKAIFKFIVDSKYAPTVIYMSPQYYFYLTTEMIGDEKYVATVHRRVQGLDIIIAENVEDFKLE